MESNFPNIVLETWIPNVRRPFPSSVFQNAHSVHPTFGGEGGWKRGSGAGGGEFPEIEITRKSFRTAFRTIHNLLKIGANLFCKEASLRDGLNSVKRMRSISHTLKSQYSICLLQI